MGRDLDRIDINFVTPNTIKWLETIGAVPQGASVERYTRETTSRRSRIALDYRPWVLHASESSAAQSLKVIGVYRNNTLTHTVVDTGTCLVDMTKYVDNHTFPDDSARDECPRRTTFQIAMELLNIYGADWFGVDGGPLLEDVCFTNNFSEVTAVDPPLTASLRSLLMQARPDAKHLKEFFKTLVEIGPSIPAQLTIGKLAPDKAVDFVVTHKRWPYTSSELMTGSTIRVVFPRFGLQLEPYIDTKLPGVGVFSAKLPQASSADGYLLYKSNPAREWEARLPIHIPVSITKYSKKNLDIPAEIPNIPLCVRSLNELAAYANAMPGFHTNILLPKIIKTIADATPDMSFEALIKVVHMFAREPKFVETKGLAGGRVVAVMYDMKDRLICFDVIKRAAGAPSDIIHETCAVPIGVPSKTLTGFLTTMGLSASPEEAALALKSAGVPRSGRQSKHHEAYTPTARGTR